MTASDPLGHPASLPAAVVGFSLMLFSASSAFAAEANEDPAPARAQPQLAEQERRPRPDYDGRPDEPDRSDGAGIWALRVVLFPAYVVSEFVLRRPLGWLTVEAERINLPGVLLDFFTFGPNRDAMLIPTALIDFGFAPSVGLYLAWDNAIVDGNALRVHAATGGTDWLRLTIGDRFQILPGARLGVELEGWRRPDWVFYGLGPRSRESNLSRYTRIEYGGTLRFDAELGASSTFEAYAGVGSVSFRNEGCCGDRNIGRQVRRGVYPAPPGFETGYEKLFHGLELALDSRKPRPGTASGVRLVGRGEQVLRLAGNGPDQWVRYGGSIGGFLDVTGHDRVLGLSVMTAFADPIGSSDEDIPFTEQILLGGEAPLRGFLEGRLVDRSAIVARAQYTWPVWVLLDGALMAEAGNVYGEHLSGFELGANRLSFGLGIRAHGRRDRPFEALIGLGTKPLDEGAAVDFVRFVFGVTDGY